jgi:hypothetical protein
MFLQAGLTGRCSERYPFPVVVLILALSDMGVSFQAGPAPMA